MVSQNIGNGTGMLYATDIAATKIISCTRNDAEGVRNMRTLGAGSAPIAAERSAVATVTFTAVGGAGNITAVTIAAVNQIGGNVAATVGDTTQTATDVAAAINSYTPGSGVDFTANSIGAVLYIYSTPSAGQATNGQVVTVSVSNAAITTTKTDFAGGSSETGNTDSSVGLRFYLDPKGNASRTSFASAEEVTKYIVVRGLQTGIVTKTLSVNTGRLTGIDRSCAITQIFTDTQSSAATDDLDFIETVDFVEGDVIRLTQYVAGRVVTVTDANTSAGNIYLTNQSPFNCEDNKSIELRLQYDSTLGLIWIENGRSVSQGYVSLTRVEMRALISTGTVIAGQTYFITDVGMAGIQVQGIDANSISSQGQYIGYYPDYQNVSGDFAGDWNYFLASCIVGKLYAHNGAMFQSVNGVTGSDPASAPTSEWLLIDITDPRYQKEILIVQYDVVSNTISKGEDARGNIVTGATGFATFKWGCDTCNNNTFFNCTGDIYNIRGVIEGNSFVSCQFDGVMSGGNLINNSFVSTRFLYATTTDVKINLTNCSGVTTEIYLENASISVDFEILGVQFINGSNSPLTAVYSNGGNISGCQFITNSFTGSLTIEIGAYDLIDSYIGLSIRLAKNETALFVTHTSSNFEATIDLDASLSGNMLNVPSACNGAGIWNVTSATTKTIDKISPVSTVDFQFPITIKPVNAKSVVIDTTAIGSAVTDNIVSDLGNETLVGRTNGGDFYTIQRSGTMWQKINSKVNV